ncbi:MAG: hypothetical protein ACJ71C_02060, partial [Nitrososphaeraceae archaeon]
RFFNYIYQNHILMITSEIKDLFKGNCDRCRTKLTNWKYALVFTDNGIGTLEYKPEFWCFDCIKNK